MTRFLANIRSGEMHDLDNLWPRYQIEEISSRMRFLHELGHASAYDAGIEAAFNAWIAANPQTAPTQYAGSSPREMFPEAFALYHTDPHSLCTSAPLLYAWLDALATTGRPPTRAPAAPSSCP